MRNLVVNLAVAALLGLSTIASANPVELSGPNYDPQETTICQPEIVLPDFIAPEGVVTPQDLQPCPPERPTRRCYSVGGYIICVCI